jgi:NADH-quinone oxidoreductase subunit H
MGRPSVVAGPARVDAPRRGALSSYFVRISTNGGAPVYKSKPGPMNWLRPFIPVALLAAIAWLSAGAGSCAQQPMAQLIDVREVTPSDVELGDRLTIVGEGFPAGRPARVTFRGDLRRPGELPIHRAEVAVEGTVVGPEQLEVPFGEAAQALFCGAGDRAAHTTFEGEVEVAFAAAALGAAPVAGTLRQVVLDVRPSAAPRNAEVDEQGRRLAAFAGLQVAAAARRGLGLPVEAVATGSRAEAAGLLAGDVIATFDGLRVDSVGDLAPAPGQREATVGVRRVDAVAVTPHALAVEGLRRPAAAELLGSALLLVGALAIVLLFGSPMRPSAATSLQQVIARARARIAATRPAGKVGAPTDVSWDATVRALAALAMRDVLPPPGAPGFVDFAACALLAAMPFGQYLVAARLDVGLLFVVGATALAVAAFTAAASLWGGIRAAAHVFWQHVAGAIAIGSVVLTTGSLRVQEIEHAQGGWPWDWLAFRSPAALVALLVLLGCAVIDPDAPSPTRGLASTMEGAMVAPPRGPWRDALCRAHRLVVAGLACALFLGGWSLPGLSPGQQEASPWLEATGAAWWLLKTGTLAMALSLARVGLGPTPLPTGSRAMVTWVAPLSLVAFGATAAWIWWSPGPAAQLLISGALVTLAALWGIALVQRLKHGVAGHADARLSPFL